MELNADDLPTDPERLRALIIAERAQHAERIAQVESERDRLRAIIRELQRHRFGRRSERLDPDQLALALEDLEQLLAAAEAEGARTTSKPTAERSKTQRKFNRGALPAHLPRIEKLIDIADRACPYRAREMHKIGEDVAERLDVAHVVVSKYADHLPLYRQAQIYTRQGIELDRSTLADWVGWAAWFLRPLHERLLDNLRRSPKLFADETTAPVLDPGRGQTKTGQLWAYARDDRHWAGPEPPAVAYLYAPDRKTERPVAHLQGFRGILQVDGYAGYRALAEAGQVEFAFCWAHVRRRF